MVVNTGGRKPSSNCRLLLIQGHKVAHTDLILKICALSDTGSEGAVVVGIFQRNDFEENKPCGRHFCIFVSVRGDRAQGLCTIHDRESIYGDPLSLCIGTVEVIHLQALAIRSETVVEIEKMVRFFSKGFLDAFVDFGGAFVAAKVRGDQSLSVRLPQIGYGGDTNSTVD